VGLKLLLTNLKILLYSDLQEPEEMTDHPT